MSNRLVPRFRFKEFNNEWNKENINSLAIINPNAYIPKYFYYIDLDSVNGILLIKKPKLVCKYNAPSRAQRLAKNGDIFFQSVRPYQKNNYYFNLNPRKYEYLFSSGYIQLRSRDSSYNYFLFSALQNNKFVFNVLTNCTGGSYPAINSTNFKSLGINFPSFVEQQKIGQFFSKLDRLIDLQSQKLSHLKQLKKGYLQKMFPQKGESIPRLRFDGFRDEWINIKLGQISTWKRGKGLLKSSLNSKGMGTPVVHYADLYKFSPVQKNVIHWSNSNEGEIIPNNSLLFPMSDVTPNGLATTTHIYDNHIKASGDTLINKIDKKYNASYISYYINANPNKILRLVTGTSIKHINSTSLSIIKIDVPSSFDEQLKIANLFNCMNKLIKEKSIKISNLKQLKKAYLQKMFV